LSILAAMASDVLASDLYDFSWQDGERVVRFGRGAVFEAPRLLGDGFTLLSTARARAMAPAVEQGAARILEVGPGRVDDLAAELRAEVTGDLIVGLGGGRVIDTAKALAAADPPRRAAAIPTTLSAAEMTRVHRHARGVSEAVARVRPALVINDPELCASQPAAELAGSAANALSHALEGPLTILASPVPSLAGAQAAALIERAYAGDPGDEPNRDDLALAALLSGYAIDSCGYGLHHVMSQTLVRLADIAHAAANAAMLPHTLAALERRRPERLAALTAGLAQPPAELARRLADRAGASRLRDLDVTREALDQCAKAAAERSELGLVPPAPDVSELRGLYEGAW
jgi:alcohol dehydrogenase class IV